LRRALSDSDPRIRIAAYEALLDRDDPFIVKRTVGKDSFHLDTVRSDGPQLIYVKRTRQRRIVLFADRISVRPPLFAAMPDHSLLVHADQDADAVTMTRRTSPHGGTSPAIQTGFGVEQLVTMMGGSPPTSDGEPVRGLGVDYGSVVLILSQLCESGAIHAQFVLESPDRASWTTSQGVTMRPEAEF
jgi:hypothetical protein